MITSKKRGGLGLGSIKEANMALLLKWWWRLRDDNEHLWAKVILALHGRKWKKELIPLNKNQSGIWKNIAAVQKDFEKKGIDVYKKLVCKIGSGEKVRFWEDVWISNCRLKDSYPSLYRLAENKRVTVKEDYKSTTKGVVWDCKWIADLENVQCWAEFNSMSEQLGNYQIEGGKDVWGWMMDPVEAFTVKAVKDDLNALGPQITNLDGIKWCNWVIPKANLLAWRSIQGRIPTRVELSKRGVQVGNVLCPNCGLREETVDHLLVSCATTRALWWIIGIWIRVDGLCSSGSVKDLMLLVENTALTKKRKKAVKCVTVAAMWKIWLYRNERVFRGVFSTNCRILEDVMESTYLWLKNRENLECISYEEWCNIGPNIIVE
ncbi:putative reverse transcriptase zinc-binding domain-containing protein [Helianthus annuus]|nr:putative reverse transcriptase zinc-binding domain-containing protein [Helianthus annuus]